MILIVDDEPSALVLLEMILKRDGYIVRKAATGREALRLLDREDEQVCEVLITDIRMPEMDGRQLVTELRAHARTASIPVIMCTSLADRGTVIELIGQGVRDYIVKPVHASTLLAKVRNVLYGQEPMIEPQARTIERQLIESAQYGAFASATIPAGTGRERACRGAARPKRANGPSRGRASPRARLVLRREARHLRRPHRGQHDHRSRRSRMR